MGSAGLAAEPFHASCRSAARRTGARPTTDRSASWSVRAGVEETSSGEGGTGRVSGGADTRVRRIRRRGRNGSVGPAEAVAAKQRAQVGARDPEELGGARAISAGQREHARDVLAPERL